MNKDELVRKLAEEFGISTIDIYQLLNNVIESMSNALVKGKNINISEFGKFKTLSRKDDSGNTIKTVSFSPVKKFASEINFRYNDLNPTPIGLSKETDEEVFEEVYEEVTDNVTFYSKNLSVNINPSVMDNKDKYDGNIIRDEISKDTSNDPSDAINAFINSKLEKPQDNDNSIDSGIKEFELPHTLIELHNDITNEQETENTDLIETPQIKESVDLESLIEERKKALGDITTEQESGQVQEQTSDTEQNSQQENRDNLDEFKTFEEERNAELSKIIEERNKIIDDIHEMVNNTRDIPEMKVPPVEDKSLEINQQIETPVEEKQVIQDLPPLQEDKTYEHKFYYEADIQDNFDPIVTNDESNIDVSSKDNNLTPLVSESIKIEAKRVENPPTSFEDVFETKDSTEKQKEKIHASLPPVNQENNTVPPPPVQHTKKPQTESYREKMQKRQQMYEDSTRKSQKKGLWITLILLGFLLLIIYLAYNTGSFSPPADQNNANQQDNGGQQNSEQNKNEQTPPPVGNEKQETKSEDNKQGNRQNKEQTPPTPTNVTEEVVFDNALNVAFVKTSDGVYIQTASLKNKSDADKMASGINKGNKEVFVKEADLGDKGKYYRIRIGKFASIEEAKEFAGKLK